MRFKKHLETKLAQAMIEYMTMTALIVAAVVAVGLLGRVRNTFSLKTSALLSSQFQATVGN